MTDHVAPAPNWVPDACTLPTAEQPLRLAEFDALFAASVRGGERLSQLRLRVDLSGAPDLEASVRDLVARESQCCGFFTFTVTARGAERVQLDIGVPAGQVEVLDALQRRADAVRGAA
ncbi:hypothetical protein HDA40_001774 [Hamadaea flava]|uniref:Arsenate reductase n=1 Tax=Hamadaea flava TaxID=1742688 RepID=A0ABV8LQQ9_9ACTN|nr:hypothetical protein [Hamadaea flava]MCP2323267.1 hypothetical protein [Hamadaea flava]